MSIYNIKLEDKAAFINRLDKLGIGVDSYEIKDDKLKGAFEFTVDDPVVDKIIKTILKQSPKINRIKEMKTKMTKSQLAEIIREELKAAKVSKKKIDEQQLNEGGLWQALADNWQSLIAIPTIAAGVIATLKGLGNDAKTRTQALIAKGVDPAKAKDMADATIYGGAKKSMQAFGDQ